MNTRQTEREPQGKSLKEVLEANDKAWEKYDKALADLQRLLDTWYDK